MVVQATDNGWNLAINNQKQVLKLKAANPSLLEKWGFLFLGQPHEGQTRFSSISKSRLN
jgi:hypothetical protein